MNPRNSGGSAAESADPPLSICKSRFRRTKSVDTGDGNYQRNADRVIGEFIDLVEAGFDTALEDARSSPALKISELSIEHYRDYAEYLGRRVRTDEIAGSTARTYFNYVSAFTDWLNRRGYLAENIARRDTVTELLPSKSPRRSEQQFWSDNDREQLQSYLSERTHDVLEDESASQAQRVRIMRDRALAYVVMFSGGRIGELLRDPNDGRRHGIRWGDLHLERGTVTALGKSGNEEDISLPPQTRQPLEQLERVLEPESTWPIFPTLSPPAISRHLRSTLKLDDDRVDELSNQYEMWVDIYRDSSIKRAPRSLTTEGGRKVMRNLSEAAEIETDVHDYLAPHGARRGVGDKAYRKSPAQAQQALRHKSIETTESAYSHIEASETADWLGGVFDDADENEEADDLG